AGAERGRLVREPAAGCELGSPRELKAGLVLESVDVVAFDGIEPLVATAAHARPHDRGELGGRADVEPALPGPTRDGASQEAAREALRVRAPALPCSNLDVTHHVPAK